ncbi:hypothetical protein B0W47_14140 [Komagataeibacter nataicola]|uniref:LysR family transcriptional regulator n=1 Tax=Komagataeibacter nataicola TaxID=265960 RepID=A0A9N7H1V5_9PROT|nr:LysR substrate-binding domain-containing protein [Komagataeibacter nataicola]AQU88407.1 hypothetical protein B0W47_14140 [Komagataeibacter nataicola]PYD65212.1 LysR family transcriptional regulator [Komagataeibacter nataicola]WEQ54496.1 LysR substrate-binding domain-containing protein [Komagataeibacter nataicola]WNM08874.1 LysR substrate-binding domain-containing protein [Komagataeibacter nataicola]GBR21456.1 transcriptional regulator [Komagataeibacter nataicola NRIC 0616]
MDNAVNHLVAPNITAKQIEAFHAVVLTGSMTAAARYLGRSQSAISRLVLELEEEIGFTLFMRSKMRLVPTRRALVLHEEVRRSFIGMDRIAARAGQLAMTEVSMPIDIAAPPAMASGLIPAVIARLEAQGDSMRIMLRSMNSENVLGAVIDNTVNIGMASLPIEHANARLLWIGEAPCVTVMAQNNPLARHERLSLAQLDDQNLITVANPFRLRGVIDTALQRHNVAVSDQIETNTSLSAIMAARAGLGVALVDPLTAYGIPVSGTTIRPIDMHIPWIWGVITPAHQTLSKDVLRLVDMIEITVRDLLPCFRRHKASDMEKLNELLFSATATSDIVS